MNIGGNRLRWPTGVGVTKDKGEEKELGEGGRSWGRALAELNKEISFSFYLQYTMSRLVSPLLI